MRLVTLAMALSLHGFAWGWKSENDCKNDILKLAKLFGDRNMAKPFAEAVRKSSGPYCAKSQDPKECDAVFKKDWTPVIKFWMSDPTVVVGFCADKAKLTGPEGPDLTFSICDQCDKDMDQLNSFLDDPQTWEDAMALLRSGKYCRRNQEDRNKIEACIDRVHILTPLALQLLAETVTMHKKEICQGLKKGCKEEL